MIVGIANDGGGSSKMTPTSAKKLKHVKKSLPAAAFIINKASVDFYLETVQDDDLGSLYDGYEGFRKRCVWLYPR